MRLALPGEPTLGARPEFLRPDARPLRQPIDFGSEPPDPGAHPSEEVRAPANGEPRRTGAALGQTARTGHARTAALGPRGGASGGPGALAEYSGARGGRGRRCL